MKPIRRCAPLLSIVFAVLVSAARVARADVSEIHVDLPTCDVAPADGKTVMTIEVKLVDGGKPASGAKVVVSGEKNVTVLTPQVLAIDGTARVLLRAGATPGDAEIKVAADKHEQILKLKLEAPPHTVDFDKILGALGTFFFSMMLVSMGAEKMTDLVKLLVLNRFDRLKARPRLKAFLEPKEELSTAGLDRMNSLWMQMGMRGAPRRTRRAGSRR